MFFKIHISVFLFAVAGEWTMTGFEEKLPFLIHDSGCEARSRAVVFATDRVNTSCKGQHVVYGRDFFNDAAHFPTTVRNKSTSWRFRGDVCIRIPFLQDTRNI